MENIMFVLDDYEKAYCDGDEELRSKIEESHNYIPKKRIEIQLENKDDKDK